MFDQWMTEPIHQSAHGTWGQGWGKDLSAIRERQRPKNCKTLGKCDFYYHTLSGIHSEVNFYHLAAVPDLANRSQNILTYGKQRNGIVNILNLIWILKCWYLTSTFDSFQKGLHGSARMHSGIFMPMFLKGDLGMFRSVTMQFNDEAKSYVTT